MRFKKSADERKKAAITGANGFLGRALVFSLWKKGVVVNALTRRASGIFPKGVKEYQVDIISGGGLTEALKNVNVVYHLAGRIDAGSSFLDPVDFVQTNVLGTLKMLESAKAAGSDRFIFASSAEVYGPPQQTLVDEAHPLFASNPYAASKISAEKLVECFGNSPRFETVILRLFNVYGPGQSERALIGKLVRQLAGNQKLAPGPLFSARDLTYVDDVIEGLVAAGTKKNAAKKVINLGSGRTYNMEDVVRLGIKLSGREELIDPVLLCAKGPQTQDQRGAADITLAKNILAWKPKTSLERGLMNTIRWADKALSKKRTK